MECIIGIDPGSNVTGYGVVVVEAGRILHRGHGVIKLNSKEEFPKRMKILGMELANILRKYEPTVASIEKVFLGKNVDSAFKLGHARGICMYEAIKANCEIREYATRVVKKSVAAHGGADKVQVQKMVMALLGLTLIEKLDASDALALAIHHARVMKVEKNLQKVEVLSRRRDLAKLLKRK